MTRLAGDDFPRWVQTLRTALGQGQRAMNELVWTHANVNPEAALDSIVELYEWTEAAREQLNIDRIHEKRRREQVESVLQQVSIYLQRSQFLVGADALIEDIRIALKESGAAGTANESRHSALPTNDTAAPEKPWGPDHPSYDEMGQ